MSSANSLSASSSSGAAAATAAVASSVDTSNSGRTMDGELQAAMVLYDAYSVPALDAFAEEIANIWDEHHVPSAGPTQRLEEEAPQRAPGTLLKARSERANPHEADLVSPSEGERLPHGADPVSPGGDGAPGPNSGPAA